MDGYFVLWNVHDPSDILYLPLTLYVHLFQHYFFANKSPITVRITSVLYPIVWTSGNFSSWCTFNSLITSKATPLFTTLCFYLNTELLKYLLSLMNSSEYSLKPRGSKIAKNNRQKWNPSLLSKKISLLFNLWLICVVFVCNLLIPTVSWNSYAVELFLFIISSSTAWLHPLLGTGLP